MKQFWLINLMLILLSPLVCGETQAKNTSVGASEIVSVLQVPPQVFVGDRARLVMTMEPKPSMGTQSISIDVQDKLPQSKTIHIVRLELDPHGKNPKILVDFIPFEAGHITLPSFEIGPYLVSKQPVNVASVLELGPRGMETAPLEEPLLVPGTRFLLFGVLFFTLLMAVIVGIALLKGRSWYRKIQVWLKNRQVRRKLTQTLLGLEHEIEQGCLASPEELGELLFLLRTYMEQVTGFSCLSKTGQELLAVTADEVSAAAAGKYTVEEKTSSLLALVLQLGNVVVFTDALRFSGETAGLSDVQQLCADSRNLIHRIEAVYKKGGGT